MRKRNSVAQLGRKTSNRKALVLSQLTTLLSTGKLETTSVKAKVVKHEAQTILSRVAKFDNEVDLNRYMFKYLKTKDARRYAVAYAKKAGGKVRIVKVGFRKGDNAEVSQLELPDFTKLVDTKKKTATAKRAEKKGKKPVAKKTEKKIEEIMKSEKSSTQVAQKKSTDGGIAGRIKSIAQTFSGSKARARSRSGL